MELTELQRQVMQLWADKSLSTGCILQSYYDDSYHFLIKDKQEHSNIIYQVWLQKNSDYCNKEDMLDSYTTIWHPITYSRLCYLYYRNEVYNIWNEEFTRIKILFKNNPDFYNQSLLEWNEKTQLLVRDFLLSIQ